MSTSPSFFRHPIPTDQRLKVELPCTLNPEDGGAPATVCNISYTGLALELPPDADGLEMGKPLSVAISGLGQFSVTIRWHRGKRVGLSFESKRAARPLLDAYFGKTGEFPI